jgi:RNA polymerase sigma-B factor
VATAPALAPTHHSGSTVVDDCPPSPDHQRAEALLAEVEVCSDRSRRTELRQQAVVLTLDLADGVARRYRGRGMDGDDLVQVGRMALVKAAHGYRCGHGSSFAAYAVPTISGEIKRYFRDHGWLVRPPRCLQELRAEVVTGQELLRHRLQREPTDAELARSLAVQEEQVNDVRRSSMAYHGVSLEALEAVGGHGVLGEWSLAGGLDEEIANRDALHRALATLDERERRIVQLRFVEELTQSEIGLVLGVSQMQVSRLLRGIVDRLRSAIDVPVDTRGLAAAGTGGGTR